MSTSSAAAVHGGCHWLRHTEAVRPWGTANTKLKKITPASASDAGTSPPEWG